MLWVPAVVPIPSASVVIGIPESNITVGCECQGEAIWAGQTGLRFVEKDRGFA